MKVKFCCDNGANIHSQLTKIIDIEKDMGWSDEDWLALSDTEKDECVHEWAMENFSYWWEEM